MLIGILGVHGSREEHANHIHRLGAQTRFVRNSEDLKGIDGIIFPGGESTSFGRLMQWSGFAEVLTHKIVNEKLPVFGTCAGAILLSNSGSEFSMHALDIVVDRNAYGRQVDSFSEEISIPLFPDKPFHCIFIRAPKIASVGANAHVLARYNDYPILVQSISHPILAATFHPELTDDARIHEYFLNLCR